MPTVAIELSGCRSCSLCADVCPAKVFDLGAEDHKPSVARSEDCVGCSSCIYLCPSRCISVAGLERQRPFHRINDNAQLVARFLQTAPVADALSAADLDEALRDVSVRLNALGDSITETMGRGQKVVGRKAGQLAAEHLPEVYEEKTLEGVLERLRRRFSGSFDFVATVADDGESVALGFQHCALARVVRAAGHTEGNTSLCTLLHEYWAGLLSAYSDRQYACVDPQGGSVCSLRLQVRH